MHISEEVTRWRSQPASPQLLPAGVTAGLITAVPRRCLMRALSRGPAAVKQHVNPEAGTLRSR